MKWIELIGLFAPDNDLSGLGVDIDVPEEQIEEYPTLVNFSDVSYINPVSDDRLTVRYSNGAKFSYRENYEDIKRKLQMNLIKAVMNYKEAYEAANECTDILLSSGHDKESHRKATRLMDDLEHSRNKMFRICEELMS